MRYIHQIEPLEVDFSDKTVEGIVKSLKALMDDSELMASEFAYWSLASAPKTGNEHKLTAISLIANKRLIESIIWALDGTAENDGCTPTVQVRVE